MVSYCDHWMSVVCCPPSCFLNNCFTGHLLTTGCILTKLGMNGPYMALFKIVWVYCISRSHRLKIDFQDENFDNLLLYNHKAKSFDIWSVASPSGPLPSLFKSCPWGQKWPCSGLSHVLHKLMYRKN